MNPFFRRIWLGLSLGLILLWGCSHMPLPDISKGSVQETGKDFLVGSQPEADGFGLYSYLLFIEPPASAISRERHLAAIKAFLDIPNIAVLSTYTTPGETNIAYIPVVEALPDTVTAEWILDHYHYSRAAAMLRCLPINRDRLPSGPYIVSTLQPLQRDVAKVNRFLFQNLSIVPPHLIPMWVRDFRRQVLQETFWEKNTLDQATLNLRTAIGIMAQGFAEVQTALTTIISLVKKE